MAQLGGRCRESPTHPEQGVVADDSERRLVFSLSDTIPPAMQQSQRRHAARCQSLRAFEPEVALVVACTSGRGTGPAERLELLELLVGPGQPTQCVEPLLQRLAQGEEVLRVGGGVREHGRRQWPPRPVGLLVLLVELYADVLLHHRGQPDGRLAR